MSGKSNHIRGVFATTYLAHAQVAEKLLEQPRLCGLSGPTISPIFNKKDDGSIGECGLFDCTICVPKKEIYAAVKGVRQARAQQPDTWSLSGCIQCACQAQLATDGCKGCQAWGHI